MGSSLHRQGAAYLKERFVMLMVMPCACGEVSSYRLDLRQSTMSSTNLSIMHEESDILAHINGYTPHVHNTDSSSQESAVVHFGQILNSPLFGLRLCLITMTRNRRQKTVDIINGVSD